ncbi:patched family domain-containing protein [Ditylenchus destructor]|nr:patched family domain-containing protein [Ditylenchus destructor]
MSIPTVVFGPLCVWSDTALTMRIPVKPPVRGLCFPAKIHPIHVEWCARHLSARHLRDRHLRADQNNIFGWRANVDSFGAQMSGSQMSGAQMTDAQTSDALMSSCELDEEQSTKYVVKRILKRESCKTAKIFFAGLRNSSILGVVPFLLLAIGVHDAFLTIHAWQKLYKREGQRKPGQSVDEFNKLAMGNDRFPWQAFPGNIILAEREELSKQANVTLGLLALSGGDGHWIQCGPADLCGLPFLYSRDSAREKKSKRSRIEQTVFAQVTCLAIILCAIHSIVLLPAMLTLPHKMLSVWQMRSDIYDLQKPQPSSPQ